ncbi:MAG: nuclear transport factor 2 family protein [Acidimicrobiia bacterium]|nr:nuclear transport factor 2 family protein [Acidimicrobiia bacterium]
MDTCIANWHRHLRGELSDGFNSLLRDDCVFLSPIVFTPQEGRALTELYLTAAGGSLGGEPEVGGSDAASGGGGFRYVKEILQGNQAMLEFETSVEGRYVNGVDIITCDDDGMITEFKVMIRPLQAINLVHTQMRAMLEKISD